MRAEDGWNKLLKISNGPEISQKEVDII